MHFGTLSKTMAAIAASLLLAAPAFANSVPTSDKWEIEFSGQAMSSGDLVFRVTPRQGEPTHIKVSIRSGRSVKDVAKDVRDALAAGLSPGRYSIELDDGDEVQIKKKGGQPDFALELIESGVQNVSVKVESD